MRFWKTRPVDGQPLVGLAVAAYLNDDTSLRLHAAVQCLYYAILAQTYPNWKLLFVHDGPYSGPGVPQFSDPRVEWVETPARLAKFGHPYRQMASERLQAAGCQWIGMTNQDNYYVPVYFEWMLAAAIAKQVPFVYCDMVHSHKKWKPLITKPTRGAIDLGAFLARSDLVAKVKFDQTGFAADGDFVQRLVQAAKNRVEKVPATIFLHN
jgi:hypothetical protein